MVKKINLKAQSRENDKPRDIRRKGYVPAVIYGHETENRNIKLKTNELASVYEKAGESSLVDIELDGKEKISAIIKDMQFDPVKNRILHADFYKVNMKEEIEVEVPLEFVNESRAVKELGGTLVRNLEALEVSCLPGDLIDHIEVDIAPLKEIGDAIYVKDLKVPSNISVVNEPEEIVVNVSAIEEEKEEPVAVPEGEAAVEEKKEGEDKKE